MTSKWVNKSHTPVKLFSSYVLLPFLMQLLEKIQDSISGIEESMPRSSALSNFEKRVDALEATGNEYNLVRDS